MSDLNFGQIIPAGSDASRDAVHVAVAPVTCGEETLCPGEHIGFLEDGTVGCVAKKIIGIVDPYLTQNVKKGQLFYLFLYPKTVTGMRHEWKHPDFPESQPTVVTPVIPVFSPSQTSIKWMQAYALTVNSDYDELMFAAKDYLSTGNYFCIGDCMEDVDDEFWFHYREITGDPRDPAKKGGKNFFSCAC